MTVYLNLSQLLPTNLILPFLSEYGFGNVNTHLTNFSYYFTKNSYASIVICTIKPRLFKEKSYNIICVFKLILTFFVFLLSIL